jgi:hypothetical protein
MSPRGARIDGGDGETGRQGDGETGRRGDRGTGGRGDGEMGGFAILLRVPPSPRLPISPSSFLPSHRNTQGSDIPAAVERPE